MWWGAEDAGQRAPPGLLGRPAPALVYLVDRGEPAAVAAVVEYQPAGAEPIPVTRVEVSTGLDVAVLHLQRPAPASAARRRAGHDRRAVAGGNPARSWRPGAQGHGHRTCIAG